MLVCLRAYFRIQIALNYKYIPGSLCYDAIKLLVELFDLPVFVVSGWCTDLNDCDVSWSSRGPDGDEIAADGSAADDTTYNFFPYKECRPILAFRVFSAVPDLMFLIRGSFS